RRFLGEQAGRAEAAVDLVGGDLDEAFHVEHAGGLQQVQSAQHIGLHKRAGVLDAAVDVAFGREMEDGVYPGADGVADGNWIGDVAVNKLVARVSVQVLQIIRIARVGEAVEIDDVKARVLFQQVADEVAADETTSSGDYDPGHARILSTVLCRVF